MLACRGDVDALVDKVIEADVVPILLEAMGNEDADAELKESVANVISNLSLNMQAKQSIGGNSAAISMLISNMISSTKLGLAQAICHALFHLAIECSENQARIYEKGGLHAVLQSLTTFRADPDILVTALNLLKELAMNEDLTYASGIVDEGGLPIILSAMTEHWNDAGVQIAACDVIAYLPYKKTDKLAPKIAESIISALEVHSSAVDVQMAGCEALLEIATHVPEARKLTKSGKSIQLLKDARELDERCASDVNDLLAM